MEGECKSNRVEDWELNRKRRSMKSCIELRIGKWEGTRKGQDRWNWV